VFPIFAQFCRGREVLDVGSSIELCDGKTDALLPAEDLGEDSILKLLRTEIVDGRDTYDGDPKLAQVKRISKDDFCQIQPRLWSARPVEDPRSDRKWEKLTDL